MTGTTTRRGLVLGGAALAAGAVAWGGSAALGRREYRAMLTRMTAPLPEAPGAADLVRYATLAANGHNAQPWRFRVGADGIAITPDPARRTPVVDPDDHHLWASIGCAAENLALAARARGLGGEATFTAEGVTVALRPGPAEAGPAFDAIPQRQCTRGLYDGQTLTPDLVARLVDAVRARGVEMIWIDAPDRVEAVLDLILQGNAGQMADPAFRAELLSWLRFTAGEAARRGDGLYAAASGNPEVPGWIGRRIFPAVFRTEAENDKIAAQIRSSSGLAVLVAPRDAPEGWVAAGRACQALMLQARVEGLTGAFLNQTVEEPGMRAALQSLLGLGAARPDLVLRLGRGPDMARSPRRPAAAVIDEA